MSTSTRSIAVRDAATSVTSGGKSSVIRANLVNGIVEITDSNEWVLPSLR